jgi:hypothetical protein
LTKRRRIKNVVELKEFATIERELEAAFRTLSIWRPEPGDQRISAEFYMPELVRELAMLRNTGRRGVAWDETKRKLLGMKRYASALLQTPLEIASFPLEVRILIASVAGLDTSKPPRSHNGRPKNVRARKVAEITAERFFQLTGHRPTRRTAAERSKHAQPGETYGPFIDLLDRVYRILGIEASAASQAVAAITSLNKKYPEKEGA